MCRTNVCILASGNGTNALNLIQQAAKHNHIEVKCIITDNPNAGIIKKASNYKIPIHIIKHDKNKLLHEIKLINLINGLNIDWILLAGYMRILSANFINQFKLDNKRSRIINIHPSYLPNFKGKNAYLQAYQANVDTSGVTIHFVDSGVDTGEVILQEKFQRYPSDSFEDFKDRGMQLEYKLYPQILSMINNKTFTYNPGKSYDQNEN